ncbi:putative nucleotidyltransferase substrate binding domain-containing protein [Paenarthrobacter sp. NPDC092416]|uniref:putative nucleotidyltransferase substrate binding domain-containing protein n=1 Tax=Paenarthrobacter sp. NPDC092416 TaxID=3364386 RepID=UPI00380EDBB3
MKEFVDFLGGQAPYDRLDGEDLSRLASMVEVEFFAAGQEILAYGATDVDHIFVVRTGAVEVVDRGTVVDVLGPGDTFGHVAVFSGLPTALAVRAAEDTLCYRLPDPRSVVKDPSRLQFRHFNTLVARQRLIAAGGPSSRMDRPVSSAMKDVLWCEAGQSVREAAERMTQTHQKAALVRLGTGYGIVTDHDFRRLVATGKVSLDSPVAEIATTPAHGIDADSTIWSAYLRMVDHGIHHLVITDNSGRPVGISAVMDMAAADVRHPLVVRNAIASAATFEELGEASRLLRPTIVELWDADVSSLQLGAIISAVVDAIVRRIIDLHPLDPALKELDHSWVLTGSMARQEPLPDSDVDTALIWTPRNTTASPPAHDDILKATAETLSRLPTCGLRLCPHDANASYPLFNRSTAEWVEAVRSWANKPEESGYVILASACADSRALTRPVLGGAIERELLSVANQNQQFMRAMMRSALADRPPIGFVRNIVVERFGKRRGYLDLKGSALRPITSLARVLALRAGNLSGSTPERLETAETAGLLSSDEADTLKEAFALYHGLLFETSVEALRNTSHPDTLLAPSTLDPLRRRHLRDGFRAIASIQERLAADPGLGID